MFSFLVNFFYFSKNKLGIFIFSSVNSTFFSFFLLNLAKVLI
jgi:hypothetical protein